MSRINPADTAFVLLSAALVLLMTPGLAFFYGGLVRRKNVLTIMMQSFIAMGVVTILWILVGFSLAYSGNTLGLIGDLRNFGLAGVGMAPGPFAPTVPYLAFFLFQVMFAIITPALISGAFADRMSFKAYLIFVVLWSLLVYVPFVHWVWGGGFLASWGVKDFAGGIVVHLSAGMAALASVFVIGRRRPAASGESLAAHNVPFVMLGAGLLWFGWFGFNGGSALAANGVAAVAFVNTNTAAAVGMTAWMALAWWREGKPTITGAMAGAIAGLATVTPAAGYVPTWAAAIIGLLAAAACYTAIQYRNRRRWDDALDVWGVHGVGGGLGTILTGVFASAAIGGTAGVIEGNWHQLGVQIAGVAIAAAYAFLVTYGILKLIDRFEPIRVTAQVEASGLDEPLHGEAAYDQPALPIPVAVAAAVDEPPVEAAGS